jgi:hypothetical protein
LDIGGTNTIDGGLSNIQPQMYSIFVTVRPAAETPPSTDGAPGKL